MVSDRKERDDGAIRVRHVIINGKVSGPIHAQHYLELQEKSQVYGEIDYGTIDSPGCVSGRKNDSYCRIIIHNCLKKKFHLSPRNQRANVEILMANRNIYVIDFYYE